MFFKQSEDIRPGRIVWIDAHTRILVATTSWMEMQKGGSAERTGPDLSRGDAFNALVQRQVAPRTVRRNPLSSHPH